MMDIVHGWFTQPTHSTPTLATNLLKWMMTPTSEKWIHIDGIKSRGKNMLHASFSVQQSCTTMRVAIPIHHQLVSCRLCRSFRQVRQVRWAHYTHSNHATLHLPVPLHPCQNLLGVPHVRNQRLLDLSAMLSLSHAMNLYLNSTHSRRLVLIFQVVDVPSIRCLCVRHLPGPSNFRHPLAPSLQ